MKTNIVPLPAAPPNIPMSFNDMRMLAESVAKSGLFGVKNADQALALMSIAQAEGRHPALAARDYHIIQGQPAKRAEAMLRDMLTSGGKVEWHVLDDDAAEATFSHPSGGTVRLRWDKDRVKKAGINNPMHSKYPRQMLRSRLISEGVRTVCPMATSGLYVPEEVADFAPREPVDVTPPKGAVEPDNVKARLRAQGDQAADGGAESFRVWWNSRDVKPRRDDLREFLPEWQQQAAHADERTVEHEESASQDEPAEQRGSEHPDAHGPAVPLRDDGTKDWTRWAADIIERLRDAEDRTTAAVIHSSASIHALECPPHVMRDIDRVLSERQAELSEC